MSGLGPYKRMLAGWMELHFSPEFVEKFREIAKMAGGWDVEERWPDLIKSIYWWRDPAEGMGHGTDPTLWDREFVASIPPTFTIDTGLKLKGLDIGSVTVDNPVYTWYIKRPKKIEKPIFYEPEELRPDDIRNVELEFPSERKKPRVKYPRF
jgi:hypothetical protein